MVRGGGSGNGGESCKEEEVDGGREDGRTAGPEWMGLIGWRRKVGLLDNTEVGIRLEAAKALAAVSALPLPPRRSRQRSAEAR